ncbi:hypothetical protein [Arthrobacter oryzae]|nr:hypothetical protein [Arthrobacter oryzae]WLQ06121.1 hypothetical protein Q8Z05_18850 [Arthrobacter oryzae]
MSKIEVRDPARSIVECMDDAAARLKSSPPVRPSLQFIGLLA